MTNEQSQISSETDRSRGEARCAAARIAALKHKMKTLLRVIGLYELYAQHQTPGSEEAAHAAGMLALYRRHFAQLTGREVKAEEIAAVMQPRKEIVKRLKEPDAQAAAEEVVVENKKGMYRETCRAKNPEQCRAHGSGHAASNKRYKASTGAARQVMASKKDYRDAAHVKGVGSVDFVYGKSGDASKDYDGGYGLAHIEAKHGTRALHRMPYVLEYGKVEPHESPNKRYVKKDTEIAVLSKENGRWQVTTFFDENKEGRRDDLGYSSTTKEERNRTIKNAGQEPASTGRCTELDPSATSPAI